jgi:carbon-monoxide dehydrogenase medium subunit
MKAPRFRYLRPPDLQSAMQALAAGGTALAGGQSLLPALNMRAAQPDLLVDISRLAELRGVTDAGSAIRIGAATRHAEVMNDAAVLRHVPLLPRALDLVAHVAIRNRGTLGGSLALADPAAELPACAVVLDAAIHLVGPSGRRTVAATDFFTGTMATVLVAGELIEAVSFPKAGPLSVWALDELSRRRGDYALAGVAVSGEFRQGVLHDMRIAYFGCASTGRLAGRVARAVQGVRLPLDAAAAKALDDAVASDIDPDSTPGCSAATRLRMAQVLTRRVVNGLSDGRPKEAVQ